MRVLIFIMLIFVGCRNESIHKTKAEKNEINLTDIFGDQVRNLSIKNSFKLDISQIKLWLNQKYFNNKKMKVTLTKADQKIKVFDVELVGEIPNSIAKRYTFITIAKDNRSFLLPVEYNQTIFVENQIMFAGIYNSREYDYYFVYMLDNQNLKLIFDSRKINEAGLKVGYYRNDDCIAYLPNRLRIHYDNNTILFSGTIEVFCKEGIDRKPNQITPIKRENVFFKLNYNNEKWNYSGKYKFW